MKYSHIRILIAVCIVFFTSITLLWSDEGALHVFTGSGGVAHNTGVFRTDVGNAGIISFEYDPSHPSVPDARRAYLFGTGIEGYFWSESTGWATFTGGTSIIPPDLITEGIREVWTASGYAWSEFAGWFTLTGSEYYPDTASLSGYLWSETLGMIPFMTLADNVGLGFVGRVKIIGNVGGKNIYNLNLAGVDQDDPFNITTVTTVINEIRQTVAENLRNTTNIIHTVFGPPTKPALAGVYYYQNTGSTSPFLRYTDIRTSMNQISSPRTLIVIGGDIYVDTGVLLPAGTPPHALIALKNSLGVGGNIYVHGSVTNIQSTLIAEGSLYSGRRVGGNWDYYAGDRTRATMLPNYQLYIEGSLISRNTIGGAGVTGGSRCPFTEASCSYDTALRYDLNYFRDFQIGVISLGDQPKHRGYGKTPKLDDKSLIIEYDPRIVTDPPPGI